MQRLHAGGAETDAPALGFARLLGSTGEFDFSRDASGVFSAPGDDVFLVKMTYWFGAR